MEEIIKKVEDLEDKMTSCKDTLHGRMTSIENVHIAKLIKLETQMEATMKALLDHVTKAQFEPVRLIAYGLAGGILITVLGAVLARVLTK